MKDFGWEREKPEVESGDYWFDGKFTVTSGIDTAIPKPEILMIYTDILNTVGHKGGQDYLQVYIQKEKNYKLFFIDNVSRASLLSREVSKEDHYCTLMFAHEY